MKYQILIIGLLFSGLSMAQRYDNNVAYGKVIEVRPVYERVSIPERQRVCERPQYREPRANTGGAILGGIIGGVLGNQIGGGSGRDAATAVGVIAGATVGANQPSHRQQRPRCYTDTRYREERQLSGYDVTYEYQGQWYDTFMTRHPGDRVRLAVDVQVIE
ncbi:glycine zipper 2TM domain-containing protein [Marinicella gelatinilytica]|uniref:glycine zipper 2TM domain-containing protein n=1 Tax=Marinicella gelatinilytica TaxID=2996017 RepID=UPI002260EFEE|nr:glycine zipper 2TM domain-containing protein [Marinicella gelatinilytica]MCX7544289.1 glycine zipper 2TM domain-containing protein [Marinicella gelatinilytica]